MFHLSFIQWFALGLLLFRVIAVMFFILLLRKQWKFLHDDDGVQTTRRMLFVLGIILTLQNIAPIIIDIAGATNHYMRSTPQLLGLTYSFSNATFSALAGFTFWLMYRFIERENISLHKRNDQLFDANAQLHTDNDNLQSDNDDLHTENNRLNS